ncbi:MAG: hypothetical protein M3N97_05440 [Pseudomonadota bacterium]|nr:hypothetical protein [Pseudomonadota bacterium]
MKSGDTGNLICGVTLFLALSGCGALSSKDGGEARAPGRTAAASPASRPNEPAATAPVNPPTKTAAQAPPPAHTRADAPTADAGTSNGHAPERRKIPAPPARSAAQRATAADIRAAQPASSTAGAKPATADKPGPPALDLSALEQRLKDTRAIGVFTKLSLKNQVDDLLARFRAFHQSSTKSPPPADLRHQYDSLMVKVLALLQNGDPQLASAISSSREAIWGILADPEKFSKI